MKKLQLSVLFSLAFFLASSQKVYFLYIQADPEQAFFVKMNEKVSSSTASGYIIVSKLVDSTYSFSIGFPQNKWPDQYFSVAVNKKDHGYLLKNFGEKGWGLFDLQTLAVQMSVAGKTGAVKPEINNDVSAFTDILAKAADDPSLKERPVQPKPEEKKTEVAIEQVPKKDEAKTETKEPVSTKPVETVVAAVNKEEGKAANQENGVAKQAVIKEQPVIKKEEPKTEIKSPVTTKPMETAVVAVVTTEENRPAAKETVIVKPAIVTEQPVVKKEEVKPETKETVIVKPAETIAQPQKEEVKEVSVPVEVVKEEPYKASQVKKWSESSNGEGVGIVFIDSYDNGVHDTVRVMIPNPLPAVTAIKEESKKEEPKEEKKFIETITAEKPAENTATTPKFLSSPPIGSSSNANNCKETAAESDFFKLRKAMAAERRDEDMLSTAKKYFKTKCYSSLQVKNLAGLFLNDEAKYKFFDLAYTHVSDAYNFPLLVAELKDEYYVNRFRAMLRN